MITDGEIPDEVTIEQYMDAKAQELGLKIVGFMRKKCDEWKKDTGLGFALYGTPAESLCYRFARIDKEKFGDVKDITDKGYYTNSYHVDVRETIDAFSKLKFESEFQNLSSGGAISYVEIPNVENNLEVLRSLVKFIYDNIQYAEFNTKSDYCQCCGYSGEIKINDEIQAQSAWNGIYHFSGTRVVDGGICRHGSKACIQGIGHGAVITRKHLGNLYIKLNSLKKSGILWKGNG